jgi:hypothetical protein
MKQLWLPFQHTHLIGFDVIIASKRALQTRREVTPTCYLFTRYSTILRVAPPLHTLLSNSIATISVD